MEQINYLPPTLDVVFQRLFGEVGSETITIRFLETILKEKIDNIDLSKNTILRREYIDDKMGVLDIVAQFNNKEWCNIEIQCYSQKQLVERLLYYWSKLYSKQMKSGKNYDELHRTIGVLISTEPLTNLKDLPYFTSWKIIEEKYRKTILTDKFQLCIIELSKINDLQNEKDELLDWLFFLENPKCDRVIEKMGDNKELRLAHDKLSELSKDEKMQQLAEWRQKAIWDENTNRKASFEERLD